LLYFLQTGEELPAKLSGPHDEPPLPLEATLRLWDKAPPILDFC